MKHEEILAILGNIRYKNWFFELYAHPVEYTLRISWFDACSVTGKKELQHSREWFLDTLTEDGIVQTVFKAIANAEEHEVKERFRYKGKRVFNPHTAIADLMEVCDD